MGIVLLFFQNYWIFQVKNIVQNLIHVIQYFVHFRYKTGTLWITCVNDLTFIAQMF